ncbi:MAG: cyclic nucleotide-binding/CBS domain-containing protein [Pseudomonadota bacterium]|nr:MAG: cyclic nucleotide-binding/CBS domain-containing protein [Pseudomonadota bacterium]
MEVEQVEIREHIRRFAPFSSLSDEQLDDIARSVEVAYFRAGESILSFGQTVEHLHFVRSGSVEVYRRSGELYNRLGEGEIFGQFSLLSGRGARFPVRALEDSLIYFIPDATFRMLFDEVPDFADFVEVEDRTRLRQAGAVQSGASPIMTTPVAKLVGRTPVMIDSATTVGEAAAHMTDQNVSSLLVTERTAGHRDTAASGEDVIGIVTDRDLRQRVLAAGLPYDTLVSEVMSTDLVTVADDDFAFEALLLMLKENVHRLPVMHRLRPVGVIALSDIITHETQNSLFVARSIFHKNSLEDLYSLTGDVQACFVRMVNEDANSHMIGTAMATIGRSFKQRLLQLGEEQLGPPPVPYCYLALGSMARDEQFLLTDQDNAMVIDDAFDPQAHDDYFRELAAFVSDGLDRLGYPYCKGDIMATNDTWRQPLKVWRERFCQWIGRPSAESLLHSSIFFDLGGVHGQVQMADELKALIAERASATPQFLFCLSQNAQNRTPPLGFFRDFVVEKSGRHQNSINLKRRGTAPLVDVIRVHALAAASQAQNSFRRLEDTAAAGYLTASTAADLRDALEFISLARARRQAHDVEQGNELNNNLDPQSLSAFERRTLKDAFKVLSNAQRALKYRYRTAQASLRGP